MLAIRSGLTPSTARLVPPVGATALGIVTALIATAVPGGWLESGVSGSGLPALLAVAEPPLGTTARVLLALGGGVLTAAIGWAALYLLFGPGGPFAAKPVRRADAPAVRRADRHPDAPPRWPVSAAELAASLDVDISLPADLDVPLARFDPAAVPPVPREPVRPVKPLAPALAPGERLDTFRLAPPPPKPVPVPSEPPTIDALLRRLEQGAHRRVARAG